MEVKRINFKTLKTMKNLFKLLLITFLISGCGSANYTRFEKYQVISQKTDQGLTTIKLSSIKANRTLYKTVLTPVRVNDTLTIKTTYNPFKY